jgi:hypothetical protein
MTSLDILGVLSAWVDFLSGDTEADSLSYSLIQSILSVLRMLQARGHELSLGMVSRNRVQPDSGSPMERDNDGFSMLAQHGLVESQRHRV